jgi:hypothetical protein
MLTSDRFGAFGSLALLGFLILGGLVVWSVGAAQELVSLRETNTAQAAQLGDVQSQLRDQLAENAILAGQLEAAKQENAALQGQLHENDQQLTLTALERDAWRLTAWGAFTWERVWLPLALIMGLGLSLVIAWRLPPVESWPLWAWLSGLLSRLGLSV